MKAKNLATLSGCAVAVQLVLPITYVESSQGFSLY